MDKLLGTYENEIAPVLVRVAQKEGFTEPELVALRWLAVSLHLRTRKAAKAYKVFPKHIAHEIIQDAISSGKLPPPPGGRMTSDMIDFEGVSGFLLKTVGIQCSLEMQTLACKLLKADNGTYFITSDHPAVILNQFCASASVGRSYAGFSKSGFQLLLPISPALCLLFYDARVYKVGSPRHRLVSISKEDVELVNALQIQSADEVVYFHDAKLENAVDALIEGHVRLRVPVEEGLRTFRGSRPDERFVQFRALSGKLPIIWGCCRVRRHVRCKTGDRRDPGWTALVDEFIERFDRNPNGGDIPVQLERILADPNSLKSLRLR